MVDKKILRKAQLIMLDELIEVDRICKKYNISYWLDSGTLLGAVRHKGFIPWDDDIDICMLQEDYEKFFSIAKKELNDKYFLQVKETDEMTTSPYMKVRHRDSILIEENFTEKEKFHQGIFLDIFLMNSFNFKVKKIYKFLYRIKELKIQGNFLLLKKILLKLKINKISAKILNLFLEKENNKSFIGYKYWFYKLHKYSSIFPLAEIEFEGYKFFCPNSTDIYLKDIYGNLYMKLPPEKDRIWHAREIKLNEKCFFEKELERTGRKLYEDS